MTMTNAAGTAILGEAERIADLAVAAMRIEADLTPKPGLVDRRGGGAHADMDVALLHRSAEALRPTLTDCALVATQGLSIGALRARLGEIGRAGELAMLEATGGVNTHRGALWALGLLAAGVAVAGDSDSAVALAARLARTPDPALTQRPAARESHGARMRRRHGVSGAVGEAAQGFPHVVRHGIPVLRAGRGRGMDEDAARLEALLALMSHLDDTCVLHRGGAEALRAVRAAASAVLVCGGVTTRAGRRRLVALDDLCRHRGFSPGGSGDLLAVTVFLDALDEGTALTCNA